MANTSASPRKHPVLFTEVLGVDGQRRLALHVFCDMRVQSVPLDVCRVCPVCIDVGADDDGACVRCSPGPDDVPDVDHPAGRAVRRGVVAVDQSVLVRDVVTLFADRGLRMVVVTDGAGRTEGVVHESQLLRQIHDHSQARASSTRLEWESSTLEPASAIMKAASTILEDAPLREALASMASSHQRQVVVVDERGAPVGTLADVDALHALYGKES